MRPKPSPTSRAIAGVIVVSLTIAASACGGATPTSPSSTQSSTVSQTAAASVTPSASPTSSATFAGSFADLPFSLDLPDGWVFGNPKEMGSLLAALAKTDPDGAKKLEAIINAAPTVTSQFVAYNVGSLDAFTPNVTCNTLDRGSTSVAEALDLGETQNVEGVAQLPGIIGRPTSDRIKLPIGETVRVRWRWSWKDPSPEDVTSIGYLFVGGPTIYTCVFSADASTITTHEPEWEAILGTFKAKPSWYVSATIPVGVKPFFIAAGAGALWVANAEDGTVDRIDPSTNTVVATIDLHFGGSNGDTANPFGITADNRIVWVTSIVTDAKGNDVPGLVNFLDAQTNRELGSVGVGKTPLGIATGFGSVWVVNQGDGTVSRIDEASRAVTATIPLGVKPSSDFLLGGQVAAGAGGIWVAYGGSGLIRIDPASNRVVATLDVSKYVLSVAASGQAVWVAGSTSATFPAGADNRLYRIDGITNEVVAWAQTGDGASGLAIGDGALWVAEAGTQSVREIDDASAQVKSVVTLDTNSWGVAVLAASVWVVQPAAANRKFAEHAPGTVTRLDR
jgi:YVTN family beta-propeller protein